LREAGIGNQAPNGFMAAGEPVLSQFSRKRWLAVDDLLDLWAGDFH